MPQAAKISQDGTIRMCQGVIWRGSDALYDGSRDPGVSAVVSNFLFGFF